MGKIGSHHLPSPERRVCGCLEAGWISVDTTAEHLRGDMRMQNTFMSKVNSVSCHTGKVLSCQFYRGRNGTLEKVNNLYKAVQYITKVTPSRMTPGAAGPDSARLLGSAMGQSPDTTFQFLLPCFSSNCSVSWAL